MCEFLQEYGQEFRPHFKGDDAGWFHASFQFGNGDATLLVDRYLVKEDDLRGELNTWAAWLETQSGQPNHAWLMEEMIGTVQLFVLRMEVEIEDDTTLETLGEGMCRFLASMTDGVYQIDGRGFFAADGELLLEEPPGLEQHEHA